MLKITYKLETSDHNGYCSGEECEYEEREKTFVMPVPKELSQYKIGDKIPVTEYEWKMPRRLKPQLNLRPGGCCGVSRECVARGLSQHDFNYTVMAYEMVPASPSNIHLADASEKVEKHDADIKALFRMIESLPPHMDYTSDVIWYNKTANEFICSLTSEYCYEIAQDELFPARWIRTDDIVRLPIRFFRFLAEVRLANNVFLERDWEPDQPDQCHCAPGRIWTL